MFLLSVWTLILMAPIHCICDVMLLDGLRETFAANFHFGFECESN